MLKEHLNFAMLNVVLLNVVTMFNV